MSILSTDKIQIISEIGINHDGSLAQAKEMIRVSAECGADYAKFQLLKTDEMYTRKAGKYKNASGTLIIPRITKAGFVLGGAYGEGVLRINEAPIDFYSLASASYGLQIGAQQYSNIIFFMTEEALQKFRVKDGWELGADAEVVFRDKGYSLGISSKTISKPVYAVVFDQKGLLAGTSLVGAKFSRLIR